DALHGEGGRVVVNTHAHPASILAHVVDAIRSNPSQLGNDEVMYPHLLRVSLESNPNKSQNNIITHTYNVIHLRSLLSIFYLARFLGFEGFFPNYCDSSATEPISSLFRDKALAL